MVSHGHATDRVGGRACKKTHLRNYKKLKWAPAQKKSGPLVRAHAVAGSALGEALGPAGAARPHQEGHGPHCSSPQKRHPRIMGTSSMYPAAAQQNPSPRSSPPQVW